MSSRLPEGEIRKRLQRLRNYERLYPDLRRKYAERGKEIAALKAKVAEQQVTIERLLLRVEQLEAMVFGRKRDRSDDEDDGGGAAPPPEERRPRPSSSYRRAIPPDEEVTSRTAFLIDLCPDCGSTLTKKETVLRFVEDIPLPKKIVEEQSIERGWCPHCRKMHSACPIPPQHCTLGPNVRLYVLFAVTVLGQTFDKIRAHLHGLHCLSVSDGELAAIIQEGHRKLLPSMKEIEARIRAAPVSHYDETSYPVQHGEQGNYAWVKTSAVGPETVFRLGRTRGKGNAEEIRGPPSDQVAVTDDYGAYDTLFQRHALCWAHPLRKFRDLARSGALPSGHHAQCRRFYECFHTLERSVALTAAAPLAPVEREAAACRFRRKINALMAADTEDPPALATLKSTFLDKREHYLLCIRLSGVPMTNNKAERSLRHLVIKRLLSFGSRSQNGAQAMETILSVCLTLWWSKPKDYFGELRALMAAA